MAIGKTISEIWRFFDFSKMAAVRHIGFVMHVLDHPRRAFGGLYHSAKFGWNRCSSFDNMQVLMFATSSNKGANSVIEQYRLRLENAY